jgi:hypothetical protein
MALYQRRTPETVEAYPAGEAYVIIKDERASVISKEEFVKLYVPFPAGR